jgi:hypothetical protein
VLEALARERYVAPYCIALVQLGLGEQTAALDALELAFAMRDTHLIFLPVDAKWDALAHHERFNALIRRCGFASGLTMGLSAGLSTGPVSHRKRLVDWRIDRDDFERVLLPVIRRGDVRLLVARDDAFEPDDATADHEAVRVTPDIVGAGLENGGAHR